MYTKILRITASLIAVGAMVVFVFLNTVKASKNPALHLNPKADAVLTTEPPAVQPLAVSTTDSGGFPTTQITWTAVPTDTTFAKRALLAGGAIPAFAQGSAFTARICSGGAICDGSDWVSAVAHDAGTGLYNISFGFSFDSVPNCQVTPETMPGQTTWAAVVVSSPNSSQSLNSIGVQTTTSGLLGIPAAADAAFRLTCDPNQ